MTEILHPNFMVIDVSHWNALPNLHQLAEAKAAGVVGIIAKASEGATWKDETFPIWRDLCYKSGILFGSYHFATTSSVSSQLENYARVTAGAKQPEIFAVDCERRKGREPVSAQQILELALGVSNFSGRLPLIYGGELLKDYFGSNDHPKYDPKGIMAAMAQFPLWLAHYNISYRCPSPWKSAKLWQWTDGTNSRPPNWRIEIAGFPGSARKLDLNHFDGGEADLRKFWGMKDEPKRDPNDA
jgi:lysozyme